MSNQSNYPCPICGADNMCTDFTDGFKWGRAYCNSCDCGGPEVRTGYDENLDAPWRTDARKQFVEVVNEHLGKCDPWVKTTDRLPTEADGYVIGLQKSRFDCGDGLVPFVTWYAGLNVTKSECVYWMPLPKLPEVEE